MFCFKSTVLEAFLQIICIVGFILVIERMEAHGVSAIFTISTVLWAGCTASYLACALGFKAFGISIPQLGIT